MRSRTTAASSPRASTSSAAARCSCSTRGRSFPTSCITPIEDAAQAGKSSLFVNGIDPGFANDLLPLALAGTCQSIEQIRCMEIINYDTYDSATVMFDVMGFGKPLDEHADAAAARRAQPGVGLGGPPTRGGPRHRARRGDARPTSASPRRRTSTSRPATSPKGSAAALRFEVRGMVDGKPAVVLEHVTRLRDDLCPDWPQPAQEGGSYRIEITGEPSLRAGPLPEQPATAITTTPAWSPRPRESSTPSPRSWPLRRASGRRSTCR